MGGLKFLGVATISAIFILSVRLLRKIKNLLWFFPIDTRTVSDAVLW